MPTSPRKKQCRVDDIAPPMNSYTAQMPPPLYPFHNVAVATPSPRVCDLSSGDISRLYNYCVIRSLKLALLAENLEIERRARSLPCPKVCLQRETTPMPGPCFFSFTYVLERTSPNFGLNRFYAPPPPPTPFTGCSAGGGHFETDHSFSSPPACNQQMIEPEAYFPQPNMYQQQQQPQLQNFNARQSFERNPSMQLVQWTLS